MGKCTHCNEDICMPCVKRRADAVKASERESQALCDVVAALSAREAQLAEATRERDTARAHYTEAYDQLMTAVDALEDIAEWRQPRKTHEAVARKALAAIRADDKEGGHG